MQLGAPPDGARHVLLSCETCAQSKACSYHEKCHLQTSISCRAAIITAVQGSHLDFYWHSLVRLSQIYIIIAHLLGSPHAQGVSHRALDGWATVVLKLPEHSTANANRLATDDWRIVKQEQQTALLIQPLRCKRLFADNHYSPPTILKRNQETLLAQALNLGLSMLTLSKQRTCQVEHVPKGRAARGRMSLGPLAL